MSTQDVCQAVDCKDSAICLFDAPPYDHICNCEDDITYEGIICIVFILFIRLPLLPLPTWVEDTVV